MKLLIEFHNTILYTKIEWKQITNKVYNMEHSVAWNKYNVGYRNSPDTANCCATFAVQHLILISKNFHRPVYLTKFLTMFKAQNEHH